MPTLRDFYNTDFVRVMSVGGALQMETPTGRRELHARVHYDFVANAKYLSVYLPADASTEGVCAALVEQATELAEMGSGVEVLMALPGELAMARSELRFAGRLFLYHEGTLPDGAVERLRSYGREHGVAMQFRGPAFAVQRIAIEKPLAFISHDSRDKETIARPIAFGLSTERCPVWFDEFSLKVGDRLRESIEKGLRETRKCVLVLTPHFLSNGGWTKTEFNSVFTRELVEECDVVLHVWHNVSQRDVFDYCPSLADRFAVQWNLGTEEVVRRLHRPRLIQCAVTRRHRSRRVFLTQRGRT